MSKGRWGEDGAMHNNPVNRLYAMRYCVLAYERGAGDNRAKFA